VKGRQYEVIIELTRPADDDPTDSLESLRQALSSRVDTRQCELVFAAQPGGVVRVEAVLRAATPLEAAARVDRLLDDALIWTGMFEEFDVTGKRLYSAPLDISRRGMDRWI
jgi:hypothetical protein